MAIKVNKPRKRRWSASCYAIQLRKSRRLNPPFNFTGKQGKKMKPIDAASSVLLMCVSCSSNCCASWSRPSALSGVADTLFANSAVTDEKARRIGDSLPLVACCSTFDETFTSVDILILERVLRLYLRREWGKEGKRVVCVCK